MQNKVEVCCSFVTTTVREQRPRRKLCKIFRRLRQAGQLEGHKRVILRTGHEWSRTVENCSESVHDIAKDSRKGLLSPACVSRHAAMEASRLRHSGMSSLHAAIAYKVPPGASWRLWSLQRDPFSVYHRLGQAWTAIIPLQPESSWYPDEPDRASKSTTNPRGILLLYMPHVQGPSAALPEEVPLRGPGHTHPAQWGI